LIEFENGGTVVRTVLGRVVSGSAHPSPFPQDPGPPWSWSSSLTVHLENSAETITIQEGHAAFISGWRFYFGPGTPFRTCPDRFMDVMEGKSLTPPSTENGC
jgi:hypothetical protein